MLPVRDGLNFGLNHPTTGLCYIFGSAIDTWPQICPSGNPPTIPDERFPNVLRCSTDDMIKFLLEEARQLNSGGTEQVNVIVGWRPRDTLKFPPPGGESCGGQGFPGSSGNNRLATVVGGNLNGMEMTAPIMAQEVGHTLDLNQELRHILTAVFIQRTLC
jgi:hypothetical protein